MNSSASQATSKGTGLQAAMLALVLVAGGLLVAPRAAAAGVLGPLADLGLDAITGAGARDLFHAAAGTSGLSKGSDGRYTFLLLGSDARDSVKGDRTDIIMLITINPKTKQMAAMSIPRDVARVPICRNKTFTPKINGMFASYRSEFPKSDPARASKALNKMRVQLGCTFGIQIDYYALMRMPAFSKLTDRIGGYRVNIPVKIEDRSFQDDPNKPKGIFFPQATSWLLQGNPTTTNPLCNGLRYAGKPNAKGATCRRAIVYVRTRKGAGNSDFKRQRRAQDVVYAAIKQVVSRGQGAELTQLARAGVIQINELQALTNLPLDFSNVKSAQNTATALELYALLDGARLRTDRQFVLAPTTYASKISGSSSYQLKIKVVRDLAKKWFGPVS